MPKGKRRNSQLQDFSGAHTNPGFINPARIYAVPEETRCLDPNGLAKLEKSFRSWVDASPRADVRASRKRILLIFLLIRYTGARLNEVLALDLSKDIDTSLGVVRYGDTRARHNSSSRDVQISSELVSEIEKTLGDSAFAGETGLLLKVDAGHVRRKFYERAVACGFAQDLGSPSAIRKARAVELMRNNMPLPVVQRVLGHSTPNLTAALIDYSEEDIHQVARHFIETEFRRKSSARNTFFGKIGRIRRGDIQSLVGLVTVGGDVLSTVITNNSLKRMGLRAGSLIRAEVKAPWVVLQKGDIKPSCTAENIFLGTVIQILRGKLTSEFIVRIQDGTELCSLVTEEGTGKLEIKENDNVWAMFNSLP